MDYRIKCLVLVIFFISSICFAEDTKRYASDFPVKSAPVGSDSIVINDSQQINIQTGKPTSKKVLLSTLPIPAAVQLQLNSKLSAEIDGSITNEIQVITFDENTSTLTLSRNGGSVTIPRGGVVSYNDLTDKPTIPANINDLSDVDTTGKATGKVLKFDASGNLIVGDDNIGGPGTGEENVQADWNQADNTLDDYIKNKPVIPSLTSQLTNDSGFLISNPNIGTATGTSLTLTGSVYVPALTGTLYSGTDLRYGLQTVIDELDAVSDINISSFMISVLEATTAESVRELIGITTTVPTTSSDTCTAGVIAEDSSYFYVCVATNTWKRAALSAW